MKINDIALTLFAWKDVPKVSYGAHAAGGGETNMGLPAIETDDSAMAGAFFATLECELLGRRRFRSQAKACIAGVHFIEGFCNLTRGNSNPRSTVAEPFLVLSSARSCRVTIRP
jgi:hypothetical protein